MNAVAKPGNRAKDIATGRAATRLEIIQRVAFDAAHHSRLLVRDLAEAASLDSEGFALLRGATSELRKALSDLEFIAHVEAVEPDRDALPQASNLPEVAQ